MMVPIRAATNAPAHMQQGSRVTAMVQSVSRRLPDGDDFRVGGGVTVRFSTITSPTNHIPIRVEDHRPHWDVAKRGGDRQCVTHFCFGRHPEAWAS